MKRLFLIFRRRQRPLTDWQKVFALSRLHGAKYTEPEEIGPKWDWPKNGFLTRRKEEK